MTRYYQTYEVKQKLWQCPKCRHSGRLEYLDGVGTVTLRTLLAQKHSAAMPSCDARLTELDLLEVPERIGTLDPQTVDVFERVIAARHDDTSGGIGADWWNWWRGIFGRRS